MKRNIDVCLSPELIHLYDLEGKIVVVVDILRATSVMVTAMAHGAKEIIPVATLDEAKSYLDQGYLCAAERGGAQVEGFPLDNSPFSYMNEEIKGQPIVITTTNGTLAITKSTSADQVLVGAFINIQAVADYIVRQGKDVIVHCAGWKGKTNMEDTLFAGALVELLCESHDLACDTAHLSLKYYQSVKDNLFEAVKNSAHAKRLNKLDVIKDIEFCVGQSIYDLVPVLEGDKLVAVK
ncbi:2-phosphosulfolactate phosphatase [Reichenbachiella carrageenanivorans]|uniref:Probable 2-phosphosulfolactate phosphatase n=1 Tax=Reichenbachiella carrageenanivorans TaxID=2979869 RepID=A0ABY6D536_9BACT|nr:2-phosphosulfolactate phosphatase [Reichenbachiella carrageenanivorans]UXX80914.1 2-phosphosulfolactate phosphatase [Reichenbachiella carrageenanivorans]